MTDVLNAVQKIEVKDITGDPDNIVTLFDLEIGNTTLYFFPGLRGIAGTFASVSFNAKESPYTAIDYQAIPIEVDGMEINADGVSNRPTLRVANVLKASPANPDEASLLGELTGLDLRIRDLVGGKLTVRRTLASNLNKVNGTVPIEFPSSIYIIDRIASETASVIELELASPFDVEGVQIPNRKVVGKYCSWEYQGNSDRSGCSWPIDSILQIGNTATTSAPHTIYLTIDDEPIVLESAISAVATAWNVGTAYSANQFVAYNGRYWRAEVPSTGITPTLTSTSWQVIRVYTSYSAGTTYSIDVTDRKNNDYVKFGNYIWRAARETTGNTPMYGSRYWDRADICGKVLKSCKSRFQYVFTGTGTGQNTLPAVEKNIARTLPFGGFPGSTKFK